MIGNLLSHCTEHPTSKGKSTSKFSKSLSFNGRWPSSEHSPARSIATTGDNPRKGLVYPVKTPKSYGHFNQHLGCFASARSSPEGPVSVAPLSNWRVKTAAVPQGRPASSGLTGSRDGGFFGNETIGALAGEKRITVGCKKNGVI